MESPPITRDFTESNQLDLEGAYSLVYDELRRLAAYYMRQERSNHTLQPTALVHEAYLRLVKQENQVFLNRTQFISLAANMMRRILVNHAVHRNRQKREGELVRVTLDRAVDIFQADSFSLLELDEALNNLDKTDERTARVFELRFFGGLSIEETAEVLGISPATTKREWKIAALYLQREFFKG
ncbi:MAG TPA: ECF-type sigma factor [Pyrinomonadaceae bacterium]|nr:ECF-type sigma factor [Pyrinomonadaceae bacterium]